MARDQLPPGPVRDLIELLGRDLSAGLDLPTGKGTPSPIRWALDGEGSSEVLEVRMPLSILDENLQTSFVAAPMYAFAVAFWARLLHGRIGLVRAVLERTGRESADEPEILHRRRSLLLWSEMARLFERPRPECPIRFELKSDELWRWPADPWLNREGQRGPAKKNDKREHTFELSLLENPEARKSFRPKIEGFARQLPVSLFDGDPRVPRGYTRWTPGGKSAVDVWSAGRDERGRIFHAFELKADGNAEVGILSEALSYALLLNAVKRGTVAAGEIRGTSQALDAIRDSKRRVMWLVAPSFHPLVVSTAGGVRRSPVEWLTAGVSREGLELQLLPVELADNRWKAWRFDQAIPSVEVA